MIADYFTKPLQGSLFKKMRDIIMGLTAFPEEERVGNNQNVRKFSSGSISDPATQPVATSSTGVVRTENLETWREVVNHTCNIRYKL